MAKDNKESNCVLSFEPSKESRVPLLQPIRSNVEICFLSALSSRLSVGRCGKGRFHEKMPVRAVKPWLESLTGNTELENCSGCSLLCRPALIKSMHARPLLTDQRIAEAPSQLFDWLSHRSA